MGPTAYCYYAQAAIAYLKSHKARRDSEMLVTFVQALDFHLEYNPAQLAPIKRRLQDFFWYINISWEKFFTWDNDDTQNTGELIGSIQTRLEAITSRRRSNSVAAW